MQGQSPVPTTLQTLEQRPLHLPVVPSNTSCLNSTEKRVHPSFGIAQENGLAYATIGTEKITSPAVLSYVDAQH